MGTIRVDYDDLDPDALGGGLSGLLGALRNRDAVESKQAVNIVEVISEGEIEGFPSAAGLTKGTEAYNKAALKDVFLGKTPASNGDEIRAASPVNIIGSISGDEKVLRSIAPGTKIIISKASK